MAARGGRTEPARDEFENEGLLEKTMLGRGRGTRLQRQEGDLKGRRKGKTLSRSSQRRGGQKKEIFGKEGPYGSAEFTLGRGLREFLTRPYSRLHRFPSFRWTSASCGKSHGKKKGCRHAIRLHQVRAQGRRQPSASGKNPKR